MSATIIQFPAKPPQAQLPTMFRVEMAGDTAPGRLVATVAEVAALIAGNRDWGGLSRSSGFMTARMRLARRGSRATARAADLTNRGSGRRCGAAPDLATQRILRPAFSMTSPGRYGASFVQVNPGGLSIVIQDKADKRAKSRPVA